MRYYRYYYCNGKRTYGRCREFLGSGEEFGVSFTYRVQEKAGGIAQALGLCEPLVRTSGIVVILGDNVFSDTLKPYVEKYKQQGEGAKLLLQEVADPKRFGVPELKDGRIIRIEEKPHNPKSSYAVTGIYMYDSDVFHIVNKLNPSARGELEITDLNNEYLRRGTLTYDILQGWWSDAGTHESLYRANTLAKEIRFGKEFDAKTE